MNQKSKNIFLVLFSIIVILVLYANAVDSFILDIAFKPLIVISLLIYLFLQKAHQNKAASFAIGGLLFSLLGDVFLIFQGQRALFFIGGLVSFLIAHLFYIFYYMRSSEHTKQKKLNTKMPLIIFMGLYGATFFAVLFDNLGALKLPVFLYTSVLVSMNMFALNRYGKVNDKSFKLIMIGALCFTLSDSLLALNKFLLPLPFAGVWILASYAAAQYFITEGVVNTSYLPLSEGEGTIPDKKTY
jgi:uncharacterized membrane protein YhhN